MKRFTSPKQKIGEKGEEKAVMFLVKQGFCVIERNYTKKTGEIDIVAHKDGVLRFIEVKTGKFGVFNPFHNIHARKMRRFTNTCQIFLSERRVSRETPWQIDVIVVHMDSETELSRIEFLENIIL